MVALPSLADLDTFSERLGVSIDAHSPDGVRVQAALDDASAIIRQAAAYNWASSLTGDLLDVPPVITAITCAVAFRAYKNPTGARQASVGDVAVSFGAVDGSAIYLTKTEYRSVRRAAGRLRHGSIQLEGDLYAADDDLLAPTEGDPIPLGPVPWEH